MGFVRKVMDYLLGYEVKEIVVDEHGNTTEEYPLNREKTIPKKKAPKPKQMQSVHQKPVMKAAPKPSVPHSARTQKRSYSEEQQDVHTKVAYQYPKGTFRFPLIDDTGEAKKAAVPKNEPRPVAKKAPAPFYQEPVRKSALTQPKSVSQPLKTVSEKKEAVPQVRKRPFRPTEIPSPVYGFNKRPSNVVQNGSEEVVEYELPSTQLSKAAFEDEIYRRAMNTAVVEPLRKPVSKPIAEEAPIQETEEMMQLSSQRFAQWKQYEENQKEKLSFPEEKPSSSVAVKKQEEVPTFEESHAVEPLVGQERTLDWDLAKGMTAAEEVTISEEPRPSESSVSLQQEIGNETEEVEAETLMDGSAVFLQAAEEVEALKPRKKEEAPAAEKESDVILEEPANSVHMEAEHEVNSESLNSSQPAADEWQPEAASAVVHQELENSVIKEEESSMQESQELQEQVQQESAVEPLVPAEQPGNAERARGKRLVPFNVMMLKKDRTKMDNSAREKSQPSQGSYQRQEAEALQKKTEVSRQEEVHGEKTKEAVPQASLKAEEPVNVKASSPYAFPGMNLLNIPPAAIEEDNQWADEQRELLDMTLKNFNVRAKVVNVTQGPTVTRFEVHPEPGVKVNKITNLTDDIKLSLAARDIRIEAPIPGKNTIGIEVPNRQSKPVLIREILRHPSFRKDNSPLTVALGLDISGTPVVTDLNKMPHGLIAGATGSGKSVCINTIIVSLLYKAAPHEVKLMLIDPKMVELAPYNGIPHLVSPVITDAKAATTALKWAVEEMERRYELFAHAGVRDITKYNERVKEHNEKSGELPYLVIIIDELADLMMVSPGEVEEAICRIAQKARACGIHLLLATQRPSVDVITGLIKANVPTRIAFSVSSQVDSRTIIDTGGAEKLLGKGDMLLLENGSSKSVRIQGNFVSDEEIDRVVDHVKKQMKPTYLFDQEDLLKKQQSFASNEEDELFYEACEFVLDQGGASTSSLQRRFRMGYNRAARLIDMMEQQGIISEARGSKPRDVLITENELQEMESQTATSTF
ncbi:cell division protein FtsK [Priestia megaterium]|uniref:DNA translocase FtsK n=1 Tax=Priestia TaxID=2800373 RepID=UPI000BECF9A5|nr:DNA translocase FtsK [Priestia megaterium]MED3974312.1 DNA translocase FtsK [Priestia megaterium]MED4797249.1 DNA translocase FtsK [Priestia megaterium]PEB61741.1 cell division protein FtsK [Priestia megaterium]PEE74156.1 cell division protein FtsK [Priestia megaterium]PFI90683.1 cell division protein FtsK [Priestia megaterium]